MTLFDAGDDKAVSRMIRARVAYQYEPTSATVTGLTKMARGAALVPGGSGSYSAGKFDLRQAGRFHRLKIDATGNWGASAIDFDLAPSGQR